MTEEIILTESKREDAVEIAILMARNETAIDGGTYTIKACRGGDCRPGTKAVDCEMCEIIICHPKGGVERTGRLI